MADLCQIERLRFGLGRALCMKAIHGGKKKNEKIDSEMIARLTHGGNMPMAYVYPSRMRATLDLMRGRTLVVRERVQELVCSRSLSVSCLTYVGRERVAASSQSDLRRRSISRYRVRDSIVHLPGNDLVGHSGVVPIPGNKEPGAMCIVGCSQGR